jgi:chemotaxis signal transduction protein
MSVIKEVSPPTPTANIPDAPKWMNRITSFRGNMIPVIDIAKYFEFNDSEVATEQAVIDINGIVFAIMVSRIGEVLTTADLTSGEGLSKVDEKEQRMADYVKSVFKADDRVISAFDPAALATLCTLGQRTKENAKEAA